MSLLNTLEQSYLMCIMYMGSQRTPLDLALSDIEKSESRSLRV